MAWAVLATWLLFKQDGSGIFCGLVCFLCLVVCLVLCLYVSFFVCLFVCLVVCVVACLVACLVDLFYCVSLFGCLFLVWLFSCFSQMALAVTGCTNYVSQQHALSLTAELAVSSMP